MNKKNFFGALTVLLFSSAVAFTSCKKDKDDPKENPTNGTAKAGVTFDGKTVSFSSSKDNSIAYMEWEKDEKKHNFGMVLQDDATGMLISMIIFPVKDGSGTYELEGLTGDDGWSTMNVNVKGTASSASEKYGYLWRSSNGELTVSEGTVTISSMTEKNVKGTFNAILHNYDDDKKVVKALTIKNGSFDVPLIRRDFDWENYE